MTHCVDAAMHTVQAAPDEPCLNRSFADAELFQLPR